MALEILCTIGLSSQPKYFALCNFTLVTGQVTSNLLYVTVARDCELEDEVEKK